MYDFPYQGKTLQECTGMLKDAHKADKMSLEVMMWGVESLRDSPQDMRTYFDTLTDITEMAIQKDVVKGERTTAVQKIDSGIPVREVAQEVAYGHLRRLVNHYNTQEVHEKWNNALPELKTAGGFATFL